MGLMRVARRAGNEVASRVAAARTMKALAKAGGSNAPTSNRIPLSIFPVARLDELAEREPKIVNHTTLLLLIGYIKPANRIQN
jgi:hypothetical protein